MIMIRTVNTIEVKLDAFLYLQELCCKQRLNREMSERQKERLKKNFERYAHNGLKQLHDGCLGGAENGKWTSWTCEDMEAILIKAGFECFRGKPIEIINA